MSKQKFHRESGANSGITTEEMQKYLNGELSPERMHFLEKKMLEEELYEDAMEGMEVVDNFNDFNEDVVDLRKQLSHRVGNQKNKSVFFNYKTYGIAATLLLLIVSSYLFINNLGGSKEGAPMVTEAMEKMPEENQSLKPEAPKDVEPDLLAEDIPGGPPMVQQSPKTESKENYQEVEKNNTKPEKTTKALAPSVVVLDEDETFEHKEAEPVAEEFSEDDFSTEEELAFSTTPNQDSVVFTPTEGFALNRAFSNKSMKKEAKGKSAPLGRVLKGKVFSQENNEPLAGVSITLKGTEVGTLSDKNGNFSLPINSTEENTTVQISFLGFDTQEVALGKNDEVDFYLSADLSQLDEVVVLKYQGEKIDIVNSGALPDETEDYPALRREIKRIKEPKPEVSPAKYKKYLEDNLRYPEAAKSQQVEGVVKLKLSLDDKGNIVDVIVENSVGYGCDEEAVRLVKEGPKWEPKKINGIPWESEKIVKVKFKL